MYSTARKKPNRECEQEQVQNGYRKGTRTQTERVQNRYRTDMEQIQNSNGSEKRKKAFWNANYKRICSSEHILASDTIRVLNYAIRVLTKDLKMNRYNVNFNSFACISSLMVLKVLGQLVTFSPRAITVYRSLCISISFRENIP